MNLNERLNDLREIHNHWKSEKQPLSWWRSETGNSGCNIRIKYHIPLSHPASPILIDYMYVFQLKHIARATKNSHVRKLVVAFKKEVRATLILKLKEKGVPVRKQKLSTAVAF